MSWKMENLAEFINKMTISEELNKFLGENYMRKSEEGAADTTRSNFLLRAKSWKADRETRPTEKGLQYLITLLAVCAYFGNILFTKYLDIYIYDLYL